jgi:hypothetical protein
MSYRSRDYCKEFTPWNRVFLEELTITQLVKKSYCYEKPRLITVFIKTLKHAAEIE